MARDNEKARPHVLPPTSKASGIDETVTAKKMADENTRKSHIEEGQEEEEEEKKERGTRRARGGNGRWWKNGRGEAHDFLFFFLSSLSLHVRSPKYSCILCMMEEMKMNNIRKKINIID